MRTGKKGWKADRQSGNVYFMVEVADQPLTGWPIPELDEDVDR